MHHFIHNTIKLGTSSTLIDHIEISWQTVGNNKALH